MGILSDIREEHFSSDVESLLNAAAEAERREAVERERVSRAIVVLDEFVMARAKLMDETASPRSKLFTLPRFYNFSDLVVVANSFSNVRSFVDKVEANDKPFQGVKLEIVGASDASNKLVYTNIGVLAWITRDKILKEARQAFANYNIDPTDALFKKALERHLNQYDREICNRSIMVVPEQMRGVIEKRADSSIYSVAGHGILGDSRDAIQHCQLDKNHGGDCSPKAPITAS